MFCPPKSLRNFLTSVKAPFHNAVYTYKKKRNYDPSRLRLGESARTIKYCRYFALVNPLVTRKSVMDIHRLAMVLHSLDSISRRYIPILIDSWRMKNLSAGDYLAANSKSEIQTLRSCQRTPQKNVDVYGS